MQPAPGLSLPKAGAILRCPPLQQHANHFFTAASLQLRHDEAEWQEVAALAGVPADRLLLLRQVHGRTVAVAAEGQSQDWQPPEADAVVSDDPSVALVVRVADCAPILLADARTGAVAAIHAGWRSTMQRIVDPTLAAMRTHFGVRPADVVAAIGPSLGACCGEMGEEVVEAFRHAGHGEDAINRWFLREPERRPHFDLWRANYDQLVEAGVAPGSIHISALCTRSHPDVFHSYRSAGPKAGTNGGGD